MEHEEFVKHVQDDAELAVPDEAATVMVAVLGTLGEMLSPTEQRYLAAQLPKPLKDAGSRKTLRGFPVGVARWSAPRQRPGSEADRSAKPTAVSWEC
jgi:uncharacterized protein (DUF2267 family)